VPVLHCTCGKTLLIQHLADAVKQWGWQIVSVTALPKKPLGRCAECQAKEKQR
jgi:D-arabinose 5-phosphate isomerase GutQ